ADVWRVRRLEVWVPCSTGQVRPRSTSPYAAMSSRRPSPVASCAARRFGPWPCAHQYSERDCRTRSGSGLNWNVGTFCGMRAPSSGQPGKDVGAEARDAVGVLGAGRRRQVDGEVRHACGLQFADVVEELLSLELGRPEGGEAA